jgi:pyridinium-3,5-bisthiocarboxylic acid mononucleotide nickel chelatase
MNVAHVEMIGGASGNMLLGALLDAGGERDALEAALRTIPVAGWSIEQRRVVKRGIAATFFDFTIPGEDHAREDHHEHVHAHAPERTLADVLATIEQSGLTQRQKARAAAIYTRLGKAEARVHGASPAEIHFHEVGQVDAILDVAGVCILLDQLGVDELTCSAFPIGSGAIAMQHGLYPNPPPATAELLRGAPTYAAPVEGEMVTTTGAAILTTLVSAPGIRPSMRALHIGYGAGSSDFPVPNVVRISIGPSLEAASASDEVVVLEANIDDMSPQHFELAIERVLAAGAHDVWLAPVTMKKSRPAILFGAIAPPELETPVARAMLLETSTLGVRVRRERRHVLERRIESLATEFGPVRVKIADAAGSTRRTLEYDDVVRIARERQLPIAEVAARLEELLPPP